MIYSHFAPLTNSPKVNMGRVGIQCYQVPVVSNIKQWPSLCCFDLISVGQVVGTDELMEASEESQTWRELVVTCVDPQLPDQREREGGDLVVRIITGRVDIGAK